MHQKNLVFPSILVSLLGVLTFCDVALGQDSWEDRMKIKGDLRYRLELIAKDGDDARYRNRLRARVALHAQVVDSLDVIIGAGSGSSDDPGSNNQSFTDAFTSKPLWLDLAYFDFHPSLIKGFSVLGGKMKNPFVRPGNSKLVWDPDLNPEGLALNYQRRFGSMGGR